MCGRYTLKTPVERLSEKFQFPEIIPLKRRYNIAPSQDVAVVRRLPDDRERKLAMLRWGLIPAWVKDPAKARQPINAKAETWHSQSCVPQPEVRTLCLSRTVWALPIHIEINSFNVATPTLGTVVATTSASSNADAGFIFKTVDLQK
jgi:hypothetical protein